MSGNGVSYEPEAATRAINQVAEVSAKADGSATRLERMAESQTTHKWGTESGPAAFKSRYLDELWAFQDRFTLLRQQFDAYRDGVRQAIRELDGVDGDAAARQQIVQAKIDQQQVEAAASPTSHADPESFTPCTDTPAAASVAPGSWQQVLVPGTGGQA
ncbi:MAG TPA: hypothetical protein PLE12_05290 [Propionicimonas sp.]|jgi:hypothetical protein|nr:hypothetical protein [Propionicimonas sp.]